MPTNYKKQLPDHFHGTLKPLKTPADLFDTLGDWFAQELLLNPQDEYLAFHGTPNSRFFKINTFRWYLPFLPSAGRFLDWGCNHAPDSCLVNAFYGDSVTIDACDVRDPDRYPVFTKAAGIRYRQLTHHISLPYDDRSFDVVIASGALEHVAFDYASLQELYRVMKPDGILVITFLPNCYSCHEWYFRHVRRNNFHKRLYSMSEAVRLLKSNGFYPKKSGYTTFFWERRLAGLGLKNQSLLIKLLYTFFPIHLVSGCMGIIAKKVASM